MQKKFHSSLALVCLLAIAGSQTASGQSGSSKDSKGRVTAIKSKLPSNADQDPMGQALTQALTDLDHCLNSNKLKDEQVNGLKDENAALHKQLDVEESRIAELRTANQAHQESEKLNETRNTAQEERFRLEEQRVALYKVAVDDFDKEVKRLRAKLVRAETWGNIKFVLGVGLGVALTIAATK